MGYFIQGKTNKAFMVKKQNFGRAFVEMQKLNVNNSLKGGGGGTGDNIPQKDIQKSYSTDPTTWFGWFPWNFDVTAKNLIDVLRYIGFDDEYDWHDGKRGKLLKRGLTFDKQGNLVGMSYDSKNGDIAYFLDTLAPFVEKGGKMHWKGEDGAKRTTNFDTIRPFNRRQLVYRRNRLIKRTLKVRKTIQGMDLKNKKDYGLASNYVKTLASKLAKYAVMCGNKLADQTSDADMASQPGRLISSLLIGGIDAGDSLVRGITPNVYPDRDLANESGNAAKHLSTFLYDNARLITLPMKASTIKQALRDGSLNIQNRVLKQMGHDVAEQVPVTKIVVDILGDVALALNMQDFGTGPYKKYLHLDKADKHAKKAHKGVSAQHILYTNMNNMEALEFMNKALSKQSPKDAKKLTMDDGEYNYIDILQTHPAIKNLLQRYYMGSMTVGDEDGIDILTDVGDNKTYHSRHLITLFTGDPNGIHQSTTLSRKDLADGIRYVYNSINAFIK